MKIHQLLQKGRLITDGAMGTYYERLHGAMPLVEFANREHPERIRAIHRAYIESGAHLLRTNTFATNSQFFASPVDAKANIAAGFRLAREAVAASGQDVVVAADIGPILETQERPNEQIAAEYRTIIDIFLNEGAETFVFETLSDISVIPDVTAYIKEQCPDAFILVQCALDPSGYTKAGVSLKTIVSSLAELFSIDAFGLNCNLSPTHMLDFLKKIEFSGGKYISAMPNASYPQSLRGRTVFGENIDHFVEVMLQIEALGIAVIGGCCGTTPEHIRALAEVISARAPAARKIPLHAEPPADAVSGEVNTPLFISRMKQGEKPFLVELDPPFDSDDGKIMKGAEVLHDAGIDAMTTADSPLAKPRADATHMAVKVQYQIGLPVIAHLSCRDKNAIGLRSIFLGAHLNGLRNFLIVTGDPIIKEERSRIKSVYEFNSITLMQYLKSLNEEFFPRNPIYYGGALNYHGANVRAIADRMLRKIDAGASYFLTQPIYTDSDVERIADLRNRTGAKIICGLMPLVSYRNALFIKNEMPGINVSDEILAQYHPDMSKEQFEEVACRVSLEIAEKLLPVADGYYFMTPFNRVQLIGTIAAQVRTVVDREREKEAEKPAQG